MIRDIFVGLIGLGIIFAALFIPLLLIHYTPVLFGILILLGCASGLGVCIRAWS